MEPFLDHVVIAVADLDAASAAYTTLLGREPSWRGGHAALGTSNTLFRLDDAYLELLAASAAGGPLADHVSHALRDRDERPLALALGVDDIDAAIATARARGIGVGDPADGGGTDDASGRERTWRSAFVDPSSVRGLRLLMIEHTSPPDALPPARLTVEPATACAALDHVVVFTEDFEASLALWRERFGLAVRWRKDFPERATRNVGLALGPIVLELIMRTDRAPVGRGDVFWGVAYRVADVAGAVTRLRAQGIDTSDVRDGLASGTRVGTLRWPRTATLLIEAHGEAQRDPLGDG